MIAPDRRQWPLIATDDLLSTLVRLPLIATDDLLSTLVRLPLIATDDLLSTLVRTSRRCCRVLPSCSPSTLPKPF